MCEIICALVNHQHFLKNLFNFFLVSHFANRQTDKPSLAKFNIISAGNTKTTPSNIFSVWVFCWRVWVCSHTFSSSDPVNNSFSAALASKRAARGISLSTFLDSEQVGRFFCQCWLWHLSADQSAPPMLLQACCDRKVLPEENIRLDYFRGRLSPQGGRGSSASNRHALVVLPFLSIMLSALQNSFWS